MNDRSLFTPQFHVRYFFTNHWLQSPNLHYLRWLKYKVLQEVDSPCFNLISTILQTTETKTTGINAQKTNIPAIILGHDCLHIKNGFQVKTPIFQINKIGNKISVCMWCFPQHFRTICSRFNCRARDPTEIDACVKFDRNPSTHKLIVPISQLR